MKKKLTTIILAILMMLTSTITVLADDPVVTIDSLLSDSFPSTVDDAWADVNGNRLYAFDEGLFIKFLEEQNPVKISDLSQVLLYDNPNYKFSDDDKTLTFNLNNEDLSSLYCIEYVNKTFDTFSFYPTISVEEVFGDSLDLFPKSFDKAWSNYDDLFAYIDNRTLGIYNSNNVLIDSISLDEKVYFNHDEHSATVFKTSGATITIQFDFEEDNIIYINYNFPLLEYYDNLILPYSLLRHSLPENFPSGLRTWINNNGATLFIDYIYDAKPLFSLDSYSYTDSIKESIYEMQLVAEPNKYIAFVHGQEFGNDITMTFNLGLDGMINSIEVEGYLSDYNEFNGIYSEPNPLHISDILEKSLYPFPTTKDAAWMSHRGDIVYISDDKLIIDLIDEEDDYVYLNNLTKYDSGYVGYMAYSAIANRGNKLSFDLYDSVLTSLCYDADAYGYLFFEPYTLDEIMPNDFPWEDETSYYWKNENGDKLFRDDISGKLKFLSFDNNLSFITHKECDDISIMKVADNIYTSYDTICDSSGSPTSSTVNYTFITNGLNKIAKINVSSDGDYSSLNGAYEPSIKISDLFDMTSNALSEEKESGWMNEGEYIIYYDSANSLIKIEDKDDDQVVIEVDVNNLVKYYDGSYKYVGNGFIITFNIDYDLIESSMSMNSIDISGYGLLPAVNGRYSFLHIGDEFWVDCYGSITEDDIKKFYKVRVNDDVSSVTIVDANDGYLNGKIIIPSNVFISGSSNSYKITEIGSNAFYNACITSVEITGLITKIGDNAFKECYNLDYVVFENENITPPTLGTGVFNKCESLISIYVPKDKVTAFKSNSTWLAYKSKINQIIYVIDLLFSDQAYQYYEDIQYVADNGAKIFFNGNYTLEFKANDITWLGLSEYNIVVKKPDGNYEALFSNDSTFEFVMENNELIKINVSHMDENGDEYIVLNGTYEPVYTLGTVLNISENIFPTISYYGWISEERYRVYINEIPNKLRFYKNEGDSEYLSLNTIVTKKRLDSMRVNYECEYEDAGVTHYYIFETESGVLERIVDASKAPDEIITYAPYRGFVNDERVAYVGSNNNLEFEIPINYNDPNDVRVWVKKGDETFISLTYDDEYTLREGSTIVILKGNYVKKLPEGRYTIKVFIKDYVNDYLEASQEFIITHPSPNKPNKYKVPNTAVR